MVPDVRKGVSSAQRIVAPCNLEKSLKRGDCDSPACFRDFLCEGGTREIPRRQGRGLPLRCGVTRGYKVKVLLPESFAAIRLSAVCPFGVYRPVEVDLSLTPDHFIKLSLGPNRCTCQENYSDEPIQDSLLGLVTFSIDYAPWPQPGVLALIDYDAAVHQHVRNSGRIRFGVLE
jgi:hypothetical protein